MKNVVKIKVKPCPYCGKSPVLRHIDGYEPNPYYVRCTNKLCKIRPQGGRFDTIKDACLNWDSEVEQWKKKLNEYY